MPKEIKKMVYEYHELSDEAKERARDWFIQSEDGFFEWENLQEDAKTVFLVLRGTHQNRMNGAFMNDARHTANAILANHGETCETFKTASRFLADSKELYAMMDACDARGDALNVPDADKLEELQEEFLRDILEDYRIMYEKNMEYLSSEEHVAEMMEANEYTFDENGRRDG